MNMFVGPVYILPSSTAPSEYGAATPDRACAPTHPFPLRLKLVAPMAAKPKFPACSTESTFPLMSIKNVAATSFAPKQPIPSATVERVVPRYDSAKQSPSDPISNGPTDPAPSNSRSGWMAWRLSSTSQAPRSVPLFTSVIP